MKLPIFLRHKFPWQKLYTTLLGLGDNTILKIRYSFEQTKISNKEKFLLLMHWRKTQRKIFLFFPTF